MPPEELQVLWSHIIVESIHIFVIIIFIDFIIIIIIKMITLFFPPPLPPLYCLLH